MAVRNADTMPDEFFPGIPWTGQRTPGSTASRSPDAGAEPLDGVSGIPTGTPMPLRDQAGPGEGTGTLQPGQVDLGLPGASEEPGYADSGAAPGRTDPWPRFSWQSKPGRNG